MKVLITGGGGFIGVRLARALIDRGFLTGVTGDEEPIDEVRLFDSVDALELLGRKSEASRFVILSEISQTERQLEV